MLGKVEKSTNLISIHLSVKNTRPLNTDQRARKSYTYFCTTERHVNDGALEGHECGKSLDLVQTHIQAVTNTFWRVQERRKVITVNWQF